MVNASEFSTRSGHRLLKKHTGKRVSEDASNILLEQLEEKGVEIAERALEFAEAADRKTVRAEDVRRAIRVLD